MDNEMDNDESLNFLRKPQDRLDPHRARSDETISRIKAMLESIAITQERTRKLLETLK